MNIIIIICWFLGPFSFPTRQESGPFPWKQHRHPTLRRSGHHSSGDGLAGNSGPDFMAVVGKIGHEFHNWTFFEALPVATPWPGIMICRCSQVEVEKERALRLGWSLGSEQFQSTMSFLSIFLEAGRYPHSVRLPGGGSKGYIFGIFPALRSQNK